MGPLRWRQHPGEPRPPNPRSLPLGLLPPQTSLPRGPPSQLPAFCEGLRGASPETEELEAAGTPKKHYQGTVFPDSVGGPLAITQPIDNLLSKQSSGGPSGLFPPGKPTIEVGRSPSTSIDGFPGGKKPLGSPPSGFVNNFSGATQVPGILGSRVCPCPGHIGSRVCPRPRLTRTSTPGMPCSG